MPVGRVYQAPSTGSTVARNTPVFGYNGIKSVSNSELVVTGKAVRSKNSSKSPSPPSIKSSSTSKLSSGSNKNLSSNHRKSPSPGKSVRLKTSTAKNVKQTDHKENDEIEVNNNDAVKHKDNCYEENSVTLQNNNNHSTNGYSSSGSGSSSENDENISNLERCKPQVGFILYTKDIFPSIFHGNCMDGSF